MTHPMKYKYILLIDDDEDDQVIFMSGIRAVSKTAVCRCMFSAEEALQELEKGEITPEVIFLDLNMPLMNGQQFLVEIKKRESLKKIPIIIFSTSSNKRTIDTLLELGADNFITKPGRYEDLVSILKESII
jgi:CheY-like chemotaxis protein